MDRLHGLLLAMVERHAPKPVFVKRDGSTTYEELEDRAARLATSLIESGVRRGDRVAVVLDGDVDYLVAFYATLMAGAAAVPVCPDTRTGPLVYVLAHARASAVILDAANLAWLEGSGGELSALRVAVVRGEGELHDRGQLGMLRYDEALRAPRVQGDGAGGSDLAAVIYTSGTTGRPKGVMLSHDNLVANIRSIVEYLELTAEDTVGMVLPFYYVYGNSVLHTHVAVGGTIAQVGNMAFVAQVVEGLASLGCTGFSGVPSTFARLLGYRGFARHDLSRLRYVTQAGAAMTPALIEKLRATLPRTRVFVMYGQTEASARLAYVPPERLEDKLGSAGKAIAGVTLKVCDPEGRELPRGELGEVVAQGPNVMLGYLDDPEATAQALRPHGLCTGDFGVMDEEGFLFLKGRKSELLKVGGHRISPFEIEQAVSQTPGVLECAVVGIPDEMLGETIAAYIVPEAGASIAKRDVLDACYRELPKFKMPSLLFIVDQLPRGQTGKLQRLELRSWYAEQRGRPLT